MRSPAYLLIVLLLCANTLVGQQQDTVFLRINAFDNSKIVLKKNRQEPLNLEDTLRQSTKNWVLRILGTERNAKIVLTNTDGLKEIKLNIPDIIQVQDNVFLNRDFTLGENFTLEVSNNNGTFTRTYELAFARTGAVTDTGAGTTNGNTENGITNPAVYQPGS